MNLNDDFKIVVLGDSNVGKTNFINQYINNKFINTQNTVGIEYYTKNFNLESLSFKIQILDTAGQEKFRSITNSIYKKVNIAILVYDITNKNSFLNLKEWIKFIDDNSIFNYNLIIVGNKNDLNNRAITFEEGYNFSKQNKAYFLETSSKINENNEITTFLDHMIKEIGIKEIKEMSKNSIINKDNTQPTFLLPKNHNDISYINNTKDTNNNCCN